MGYLLDLVYWFNSRPEPISRHGQKMIASIIAILIVIAVIILTKAYGEKIQSYKPTLKKLLPFCFTNSLIGLYLIFVNYEIIPVLRARFWFVVWGIIVVIWIISLIRDINKRKKRKEDHAKEIELKKYLP